MDSLSSNMNGLEIVANASIPPSLEVVPNVTLVSNDPLPPLLEVVPNVTLVSNAPFPRFQDLVVTTLTAIAVSNLKIDITMLYKYCPVSKYVLITKKRGRKKKVEVVDPNINVPIGSIITIKNGPRSRGTILKKKSKPKKEKEYFLNSVTVVVLIGRNKMINIKISKNGKFQITGAKTVDQIFTALNYVFRHLHHTQYYTGETIYEVTNSEPPKFICNLVMRNYDFNLRFGIDRYRLDRFISESNDFISLFEDEDKITYVNIKIPLTIQNDAELDEIDFQLSNVVQYTPFGIPLRDTNETFTYTTSRVAFSEFARLDTSKQKRKVDKYHTFLVFQSGAVIQSGRGPEMETVYNKFTKLIGDNQEKFIERLVKRKESIVNK